MMKTIEKVELTEEEHEEYKKECDKIQRSMRGQASFLIREFLKSVKNLQENENNKI